MASYQESEHFAEDFREALEDLQVNNRYDIQNLTMIARENTEHALAIAQTLQNHIKRVGWDYSFHLSNITAADQPMLAVQQQHGAF